jgi:nucleotide-binding universal stress UspA family protein
MKVLVPLDGSDFGRVAIPVVQRLLALVAGMEIHLLTVLDPHAVQGTAGREVVEPLIAASYGKSVAASAPRVVESHGAAMARARGEAVDWLESLVATEFPEAVRLIHVSWSRHAADQIVALAREIDADVIVMPTHGRSGLSHLLTGSVTERVIRTAGRPVLVVGPSRER